MTVAFRNLRVDPVSPVSGWPTEGVRAALERSDLRELRRLAEEIRAGPWRRTARQVEEVLTGSRPYGVAELFEGTVTAARERAEREERAAVAAELKDLVAGAAVTQAEFAKRIGTSASRMSSYVNGAVVPSAAVMVRARGWRGRRPDWGRVWLDHVAWPASGASSTNHRGTTTIGQRLPGARPRRASAVSSEQSSSSARAT